MGGHGNIDESLLLTPERRRELGQAALEWCLQYFGELDSLPIYPQESTDTVSAAFAEPLPAEPQPLDAVMEQFTRIAAYARHNGHPRMLGYVQSSGSFAGAIADLLGSALNQNVTSWRSAPSATTVERQTIAWICSMIGVREGAGGLFLSGGSLANLAGVAAALRSAADIDVTDRGVRSLGGEPRIYATAMTHMSVAKAAGLLGLGRRSVQMVPVTANFVMDVSALDERLRADRADGCLPVAVVGTAGDVNTGAIDPLEAMAEVCATHHVWLHVDASYGGFAALTASVGPTLRAGFARADSIALDPHKWLYAPLDAGCLIVRDSAALHRAFAHGADYVDVIADDDMSKFAFWDYGPELSRRFRALKTWFALKIHGVTAIGGAIEANLAVARRLVAAIDASDDFERLAPAPLSIVCFRHVAPALRGLDATAPSVVARMNDWNRRLLVELQRDGDSYLSNAIIGEAFALRACIVNFRTRDADVDHLMATIRRVAKQCDE